MQKFLPMRFRPVQGHSRQSWILDSTLWIADCLSVEVGFHIPIASMFLDSFNLIPDSKAHDSGSHIPESWRDSEISFEW